MPSELICDYREVDLSEEEREQLAQRLILSLELLNDEALEETMTSGSAMLLRLIG